MIAIPDRLKSALLIAALMALFWSGLFHLHPPIGWVDPGLYIYWFLNAPQNAVHRVLDYHGARLSYVLPGYLLYQLLEPVLAQKILVSGYYLLGLLAIHLITGSLLSSFTARALVLVTVGANPLWIGAFARGYVDGPCMALGLLALACLLRPATPPGPRRHAAAGALLTLALCAHTLGGGMAALAAAAIGLIRAPSPRALLVHAAAGLLGVLACLGVLGLAALALGMPFLFFQAFWAPLRLSLDGTYDAFSLPALQWVPFAPRLLLVPAILALPLLAAGVVRAEGRRGLAFLAAALVPLLPIAAWFFRTASLLQFHFYASYLQMALVPALVLFLARVERAGGLPGRRAMAGLGLALAACVMLGAVLPMGWRLSLPFALGTWAVAGGLVGAALLMAMLRRHRVALGALALGLLLAGVLNADTARAYRQPGSPNLAAQMEGLARLHRFLAATGGIEGRYLLWLSRDRFTEARGLRDAELYDLSFAGTRVRLNALDSLGASLGWHVAGLGFAMPLFAERWGIDHAATVGPQPLTLVTLCAEPPDCRAGAAALVELGMDVAQGPVETIAVPGMPPFAVGRARISTAVETPAPRPAQLAAILARVEGLDAAARADGAPPLSNAARAGLRPPDASPRPVRDVEAAGCERTALRIECRVRYLPAEGGLAERRLVFEVVGYLALLLEAEAAGDAR